MSRTILRQHVQYNEAQDMETKHSTDGVQIVQDYKQGCRYITYPKSYSGWLQGKISQGDR